MSGARLQTSTRTLRAPWRPTTRSRWSAGCWCLRWPAVERPRGHGHLVDLVRPQHLVRPRREGRGQVAHLGGPRRRLGAHDQHPPDQPHRLRVPRQLLAGDLPPGVVHPGPFEPPIPTATLGHAPQQLGDGRRLRALVRQERLVVAHRGPPATTATGSVVTLPRRTTWRGPASGTSSSTAAVTITCSKVAQRAARRSRRLLSSSAKTSSSSTTGSSPTSRSTSRLARRS